MRGIRICSICFFLLLLGMSVVAAESLVIVDSLDWRDVYLGELYAAHEGSTAYFLLDAEHASRLLTIISPEKYDEVILLESKKGPVVKNYHTLLEAQGFNVERRAYADYIALQEMLYEDLGFDSIMLIDDTYGYSAMSVAPYCLRHDCLPMFVDAENLGSLRSVLDDASTLERFGFIDRNVVNEYPNIRAIGKGEDRFEDNLAMVKLLQNEQPVRQILITNGEFLEAQLIMSGSPVLFIGKQQIPADILSYLEGSGFKSAMLIGNSLFANGKTIKDATGISVFVKFAKGRDSEQEALDLFMLPIYVPSLSVYEANYNSLTKQLEVTFSNTGEFYSFFTSTILLQDAQGVYATVGDDSAVFVDAQGFKTVLYDVDGFKDGSVANISLLFGESPHALEFTLSQLLTINTVEVNDESSLVLHSIMYDERLEAFVVSVENTGSRDAYFSLELSDVIVNGRAVTLGSNGTFLIKSGEIVDAALDVVLTKDDIVDNEFADVKLYYGQRQFALVHLLEERVVVTFVSGYDFRFYLMIGIAVAILLIVYMLLGKSDYECMHCGRMKRRKFKPKSCNCGNEVFRKLK